MKVVILAGGTGTRLSEETTVRPKPMVEIGTRPILWHIMSHYRHYGHDDFVICLGYKGEHIKRYFADELAVGPDITIDFASGRIDRLSVERRDWRVTLVDTGADTQTGARLARVRDHLDDERFLMTYGDGVSDVDLHELVEVHEQAGRLATVTAVHPPARFGKLTIDAGAVRRFEEKPQMAVGWVNGGYFVLEPGVFDHIDGDVDFAREPLESLAAAGQLSAYEHDGFWQCMDTLRDKSLLEALWDGGAPPWRVWAP
ncbi:MAG: glucose-1-phosphate cytidylyltransferase [Ilumatobacter sp.]|nr:glucose-1-phosphate cytidylyltransferase [Ilumatobacter sp.]